MFQFPSATLMLKGLGSASSICSILDPLLLGLMVKVIEFWTAVGVQAAGMLDLNLSS